MDKRYVMKGVDTVFAGAPPTHLKVKVDYQQPYRNPNTGLVEPAGVWLMVLPIRVEEAGVAGLIVESSSAYTGCRFHLESLNRMNQKKVAAWFERVTGEIKANTGDWWGKIVEWLDSKGISIDTKK